MWQELHSIGCFRPYKVSSLSYLQTDVSSRSILRNVCGMQSSGTRSSTTRTASGSAGLPPGWFDRLELPLDELVRLTASNVRMCASDNSDLSNGSELAGFGTDAAISRGRGGYV